MNKGLTFGKKLKLKLEKDRATGLAAEQSYYYMLSLFPLIILLISILPYLSIDPQQAIEVMKTLLPSVTTSLIEENIVQFISEPNGNFLTIGILGTIWSASNGMNAFIHSMNIAFDVEETRGFIKQRLLSIFLTLELIFSLIIVLALPIFGNIILDFIRNFVPIPSEVEFLIIILRYTLAFGVASIVLTSLYKFAPNKKYPFKQVIPGAVAATLIWIIISLGFSFYVSNFGNYSATYGGLGGVIVLMLWLYFTGLALVIGGEINAILHHKNSLTIQKTRKKLIESKDRKFTN